jgi:hypothetical protein
MTKNHLQDNLDVDIVQKLEEIRRSKWIVEIVWLERFY